MPGKIGVLYLFAQEGFGADGAVHSDIIRHLDRDRFRVYVACTAGDGSGEPESLRMLRALPNVTLRPARFAPSLRERNVQAVLGAVRATGAFGADFFALRNYIARERISIVHTAERPRDAAYNIALSRLAGARSVVHVHVKWSADYSALARWSVNHADAVFSISDYVTRTVIGMGRRADSIYTILNGIGTARWDPATDGGELRRELGIASDALVLASVSRLFSWKGQRELLRAFAIVRQALPNVHLLIVGADSQEAQGGSFSDELKALARELGVDEQVTFTGQRADIPRVMAACDVFTLPSFEEPFGLVYLEAMAMQRPVIGIDNGGTPEVVAPGKAGLLSPPWDVPALAANILTLLRDPELRARMGAWGRQRVLDHFSGERMARDAATAYERVLAQR